MNFEMINEDLYSVTDCLSMTDFLLLDDEFNCRYNNWYFSKKESDRPDWYPSRGFLEKNQTDDWNLGYNFQLIRIGTTVKLHCEYLLKKSFSLKGYIQIYNFLDKNLHFIKIVTKEKVVKIGLF